MAKKSMIAKEQRRQLLVSKGKYPRVRLHNRCSICGRPHSVLRKYGICRLCFRDLAYKGEIPGARKSSW